MSSKNFKPCNTKSFASIFILGMQIYNLTISFYVTSQEIMRIFAIEKVLYNNILPALILRYFYEVNSTMSAILKNSNIFSFLYLI